jgi:hypothetical protein
MSTTDDSVPNMLLLLLHSDQDPGRGQVPNITSPEGATTVEPASVTARDNNSAIQQPIVPDDPTQTDHQKA